MSFNLGVLTVNHFRILKNIHKCHLKRNDKNSAEAIRIFLHSLKTLKDYISTNHSMAEETNSNTKISRHNSWTINSLYS